MYAKIQSALIDAGLWLYQGFFAPGDYLLAILSTHAPRVAQFLGLDAAAHGGVLSGFISGVIWLGALILAVVVYRVIRDFDRMMTAYIGRMHDGVLRMGRVLARQLGIALRSRALKRQARLTRTEVYQGELSALELLVLRTHARLAPGHLSTPSGLASALRLRSSHVQKALTKLKALSLVDRTFGAGDGEDGYRLTQFGQVYLAACGRAQGK